MHFLVHAYMTGNDGGGSVPARGFIKMLPLQFNIFEHVMEYLETEIDGIATFLDVSKQSFIYELTQVHGGVAVYAPTHPNWLEGTPIYTILMEY